MTEITKPQNLYKRYAQSGTKLEPSDGKKLVGWIKEIPTYQHFNWIENRQDEAIAHINQMGLPLWDATTEYILSKSFVLGSDGNVYSCVTTNTNVNPTTDTAYVNWRPVLMRADLSKPSVSVSPTNSWATAPTGGRFKAKISAGVLFLDVQVSAGTTGTSVAIGTLPSGYRPSAEVRLPASFYNGTIWTAIQVGVSTAGVVTAYGTTANNMLLCNAMVVL